jgi:hypothetical protein
MTNNIIEVPFQDPKIIRAWISKEEYIDITVKELCVLDIHGLAEDIFGAWGNAGNDDDASVLTEAAENAIPRITNLSLSDFQKLSFTAVNQVWSTFKEVNPDFFLILSKTGISQKAKQYIAAIVTAVDRKFDRALSSVENSEESTSKNSKSQ